ncbi:MAG: hypothetical protein WCT85_00510 [Parachlamydiales bacterium]|jgi:hypothetical protein
MKKLILFKMFLEKSENERLLKYLTESEISKLKSIPPFSKKLEIKKNFPDSLIDAIHYSWFIPFLNSYTNEESSLFLSAMKISNRKPLQDILGISELNDEINPNLKSFLKHQLISSLIRKEDTLLPIECLFESKMNILLTLTKKQLIKLIDYLSLYDLVKEMKYILDKDKLKKIYSYLSKDEKKFANSLLNYVEPFATQRMIIDKFFENKKKFRNFLHIRGLMRLAYALSGESLDLIWYVCHYLDIGRGNFLFKECKKEKVMMVSEVIRSEILKIIQLIKEKEIL